MLLPPKPGSGLANLMERAQTEAGLPSPSPIHEFWSTVPSDTAAATADEVILLDLASKRSWRVGPDTLATFRTLVAEFKLTHCFHNYTVGREFSDRQTQRFMLALEVRDPKVLDDGTEWISVSIHGQSFMLHQVCYGAAFPVSSDSPALTFVFTSQQIVGRPLRLVPFWGRERECLKAMECSIPFYGIAEDDRHGHPGVPDRNTSAIDTRDIWTS